MKKIFFWNMPDFRIKQEDNICRDTIFYPQQRFMWWYNDMWWNNRLKFTTYEYALQSIKRRKRAIKNRKIKKKETKPEPIYHEVD